MTEHVPFFVGHPMLVFGARWVLDDEATIRAMEFYDIAPVTESYNTCCPVLGVVCPHPELARTVDLVHQSQSDPVVSIRIGNREPGETVVVRAARDDPGRTVDPARRQRYPSISPVRGYHRDTPADRRRIKLGGEGTSSITRSSYRWGQTCRPQGRSRPHHPWSSCISARLQDSDHLPAARCGRRVQASEAREHAGRR